MTSASTAAVFLSYASEDSEAAAGIAAALRSAGVEVWLDQSELRGGDVWDRQIRTQIHDCRLFIPIISASTEARTEGYFRREWKLAVDRTHDMSERIAFLVPVVIDATSEATADVPERFRAVQWTALAGGATTTEFIDGIQRLLTHEAAALAQPAPAGPGGVAAAGTARIGRRTFLAGIVALAVLIAGVLLAYRVLAPHAASSAPATTTIAVLPFADMSEKHDQEYFSDGLSEELLDLLAKIPGISVIARTSSFYFKGKAATAGEIARALNVTHLLEGSVRRAGSTVRVTAELIRAADGVRLWSETYDRSVTDVFKIQDEIAAAVVQALKLKLLPAPHEPARVAGDQTANPDAYTQYLLGRHFLRQNNVDGYQRAADAFRKAVELDPAYTRGYAGLAEAEVDVAVFTSSSAGFHLAHEAADKAIALAPDRAEGYGARAVVRSNGDLDYAGSLADFERALTIDPTDTGLLVWYGNALQALGKLDAAMAVYDKAAALDPLSSDALQRIVYLSTFRRDYRRARSYINRALQVDPNGPFVLLGLADLELATGHARESLAAAQKIGIDDLRLTRQAAAEHSLGDEAASLRDLKTLETQSANVSAYQIAEVHGWRGERDATFQWLARAYRQRDAGFEIFQTDIFLERLHGDPRYRALLREAGLAE